jgi:hypothetical protein
LGPDLVSASPQDKPHKKITKKKDFIPWQVIIRQPTVARKKNTLEVPSNGEIDFVVQHLPPVCEGRKRGSCVGADPTIVVRQLCFVLNNTVIELDDIRILYERNKFSERTVIAVDRLATLSPN